MPGMLALYAVAVLIVCVGASPYPEANVTVIFLDDFTPCKQNETNCRNGGIRQHWVFEQGDGTDHNIPGWGNGELQCYEDSRQVAEVVPKDNSATDGVLTIRAVQADKPFECKNKKSPSVQSHYHSARMLTKGHKSFMWGGTEAEPLSIFVEARIRLPQPTGKGLWPAFWMLPEPPTPCEFACGGKYGGWPKSGEIDILEAVKNMSIAYQTLHLYGTCKLFSTGDCPVSNAIQPPAVDPSQWNVFGVKWSSQGFQFYVNDDFTSNMTADQWNSWYRSHQKHATRAAPFDQPFFLLLNLAVGGPAAWVGLPDTNAEYFPSEMLVDWVRVVQATTPGGEIIKSRSISANKIMFAVQLAVVVLLLVWLSWCAVRTWCMPQKLDASGAPRRHFLPWHWRLPRRGARQSAYSSLDEELPLTVIPPSMRKRADALSPQDDDAAAAPQSPPLALPVSTAPERAAFKGRRIRNRDSTKERLLGDAAEDSVAPGPAGRSPGGLLSRRGRSNAGGGLLQRASGEDEEQGRGSQRRESAPGDD